MAPSYNAEVLTNLLRDELASRPRGAKTRLARAVGVTPQTISKWVAGEVLPDPERWPLIEEHFGWAPGEIRRQVMPVAGPDTTLDLVTHLAEAVEQMERRLAVLEEIVRGDQDGERGG